MTKNEMVARVAGVTGLSRADVRAVVDSLLSADPSRGVVSACLKAGEKVTIAGFGTFSRRERSARSARNPKTGAKVKVAQRAYPAFKAARSLKKALVQSQAPPQG